MAEEAQGKWVGKTRVEIGGVKPDQIWPFIADFFNIHKWSPAFESCSYVEGSASEFGVFRRVTSKVIPPVDGGAAGTAYIKERLFALDPRGRSMSYLVLENNIGLPAGGYVGTAKVLESAGGCAVEWSFVTDPIEGWKWEDMYSLLESNVKPLVQMIEAAARGQ